MQGLKIAIDLKPPAKNHWNIASDPILPWILEESRHQCEAKRVAQAQEEGLKGAKMSQTGAPTLGEPPEHQVEGSGKVL